MWRKREKGKERPGWKVAYMVRIFTHYSLMCFYCVLGDNENEKLLLYRHGSQTVGQVQFVRFRFPVMVLKQHFGTNIGIVNMNKLTITCAAMQKYLHPLNFHTFLHGHIMVRTILQDTSAQ